MSQVTREVLVTDFGVVEMPEPLPVRMTLYGTPDRRFKEAPLCREYIKGVQDAACGEYISGRDLMVAAPAYSAWKASRAT